MEIKKGSKKGKYCGFRDKRVCDDNCGLFCIGLQMCVLHAMNKNLQQIERRLEDVRKGGKL